MSSTNDITDTATTDLINKIRIELVEKNYYSDVKMNIRSKTIWKFVSDLTEALAHILMGLAAVLSFAAGFFDYTLLSFIGGCFGTSAIVLLQFSSYAMKESKERTERVNKILTKLGIDQMVDISIDSASSKIQKLAELTQLRELPETSEAIDV